MLLSECRRLYRSIGNTLTTQRLRNDGLSCHLCSQPGGHERERDRREKSLFSDLQVIRCSGEDDEQGTVYCSRVNKEISLFSSIESRRFSISLFSPCFSSFSQRVIEACNVPSKLYAIQENRFINSHTTQDHQILDLINNRNSSKRDLIQLRLMERIF